MDVKIKKLPMTVRLGLVDTMPTIAKPSIHLLSRSKPEIVDAPAIMSPKINVDSVPMPTLTKAKTQII